MKPQELLTKAAAEIEAKTARIVELEGLLKTANDEKATLALSIKQTKEASEKTETEGRAALAKSASVAAGMLFDAGLFSTKEAADKFAGDILDHSKAINALGNLSSRVTGIAKVATVVADTPAGGQAPATADQVWDQRCIAALARQGG